MSLRCKILSFVGYLFGALGPILDALAFASLAGGLFMLTIPCTEAGSSDDAVLPCGLGLVLLLVALVLFLASLLCAAVSLGCTIEFRRRHCI